MSQLAIRPTTAPHLSPRVLQDSEIEHKRMQLEALQRHFPGKTDIQVLFTSCDSMEISNGHMRITVNGLEEQGEMLKKLLKEKHDKEKQLEENSKEIGKNDKWQTAGTAVNISYGLGRALVTGNPIAAIPPLLAAAHFVFGKLKMYRTAANALGGSEEQKNQREWILRNGMTFISTVLGLGNAYMGGLTLKSANDTVTDATSLFNGALAYKRMQYEEIDMGISAEQRQLQIQVRNVSQERSYKEEQLDNQLKNTEHRFGLIAHLTKMQERVGTKLGNLTQL